jgi:hypothetical protein
VKFEKMAKLRKFAIQIFVDGVEPLLELLLGELADGIMCRIMINIWQKNGLRERWFYMLSGAPVPVPTSTDLRDN